MISAVDIDVDPRFVAFLQSLLIDVVTNPASLIDAGHLLAEDKAWLDDLGVA